MAIAACTSCCSAMAMSDEPLSIQQQFRNASKLIRDCMYDRDLRERLMNHPRETLASVGFELLPETKVFVHVNKTNEHHIVTGAL